ncbi:MAG: hypothetical protein OZSIB_2988 [Candidatus Ozemobacter sibiricus]|uniref:Uncharacterized protein n=1 Tax=Candidatus Ozemobacter sibiricus TaxID=2268124 RepID=A0A367ZRB2_9BACT|nr:MAG: hypothetical protein OZSIB_2988 [Candidatus Ozemobacter sibiricus]
MSADLRRGAPDVSRFERCVGYGVKIVNEEDVANAFVTMNILIR